MIRPRAEARRRLFLAGGAVFVAAACAPALRDPVDLVEAGRPVLGLPGPKADPGEVDRLLADAEAAFARRPRLAAVVAAQRAFLAAARADETRVEGLLGLARVSSWRAEHEDDARRRAALVDLALEAGQWCERRAPERIECAYALAQALGQQARERPSTARDGLPKMVERLRRAVAAAPGLDEAGPHRVLALVLLRAPGWPAGPGDSELGLLHARRAVELRPDHPPNLLALAEALERAGRDEEAHAERARAGERAERAREAGEPDAPDWVDESARGRVGRAAGRHHLR